jgi:periplasmic divalent cation tolerance protein
MRLRQHPARHGVLLLVAGALERGEEIVMIVKTRASLSEAVCAAIKQTHSYTLPAISVLPVESVDPAYLKWILGETDVTAGKH